VILASPGWLALLLALPVLWWVHRLLARPPVVRVASVLLYREAVTQDEAAAPRRRVDPLLACLLGAVSLLALSAAGIGVAAADRPSVLVVVDDSFSMQAVGGPTGPGPASERALARLGVLLDAAVPGCEVKTVPLHGYRRPGDGLPGSLAQRIANARSAGWRGVVLVTDRPVEAPPGVVIVGPEQPPLPNVALESAFLGPDGEARVVVRNHGPGAVRVGLTSSRHLVATAEVDAGGRAVVSVGEAPPQFVPGIGHTRTYRLVAADGSAWSDGLAADDELSVLRSGGIGRVVLETSGPAPELERALRAVAGEVTRASGGPRDVHVRYRLPAESGGRPTRVLNVAPVPSTSWNGVVVVSATDVRVPGRSVHGGGNDVGAALPGPTTELVVPCRLAATGDLEAVWSDERGPIVALGAAAGYVLADPEAEGSTWSRDASLPVLFAALLEAYCGGPDGLFPGLEPGWVPQSESRLPTEGVAAPSPAELRSVTRAGARGGDGWAARLAAVGAAVLLGAALLLARR